MINLYTQKKLIPKSMELISDVDSYFNNIKEKYKNADI